MPAGSRSLPYAMAVDDRDRPSRRTFTDTVETAGGDAPNTLRHMVFHGPTREIWFATDRNTVGRVRVP